MATLTDVKNFWERNLCMHNYLKSPYLSKEYFEEGYKLRYKYHYHIPREVFLLKDLKPGARVLEIGVGMGIDTQLLCENGFKVTGIDLTQKSVEATRARLRFYNFCAEITLGNAEHIEFPDQTFDVVYSFGVLHHTPNIEKAIEEVHQVLKPGGFALIMLYNRRSLNYFAHRITFTQFDGTIKERCPVEKAFTRQEVLKMFANFSKIEIKVDYLFGTGWRWVNYFVPVSLKKFWGKYIGWHLMIWAEK